MGEKITPAQMKICRNCPKRDRRQNDKIYCGINALSCKYLQEDKLRMEKLKEWRVQRD